MNSKPYIHPNTPRKLAAAFHFARNKNGEGYKIRVLEQTLGVNFKYLHRMINKGIEPNDTTVGLREIRVKMFLPMFKRKPWMSWWRKTDPEVRDEWIRSAYNASKK